MFLNSNEDKTLIKLFLYEIIFFKISKKHLISTLVIFFKRLTNKKCISIFTK